MSAGARCVWLATCALLAALSPPALRWLHAAAVLGQLTGMPLPAAMQVGMRAQITEELAPYAGRARRYRPSDAQAGHTPGVVLLHGVHAQGIDEPRLIAFARALAHGGLDVLTPELPELLAYRLGARTIAEIHAAAHAHAALTQTAAVGVIGISFAGGLALLAASEQGQGFAVPGPIGFIVTVGAHDDLSRVCQYYAHGDVRGPAGEPADVAPHPYGARVMLREHLERFVPAHDLPVARQALDSYLRDRHSEARRTAQQLSPEGQRAFGVLLGSEHSETLSRWLDEVAVFEKPQLMAASPHGQLGGIAVPVLLLHGAGDPIVPSLETRYLAREIPAPWLRVSLVTKLLRHADFPEPPPLGQAWELVRFVQRLYEEAGSLTL